MEAKTVMINDKEALLLIPEIHGKLAVVDFETLKKIASNLNKVDIEYIKQEIKANITKCDGLKEVLEVLKSEVNFHETINLIKTISPLEFSNSFQKQSIKDGV